MPESELFKHLEEDREVPPHRRSRLSWSEGHHVYVASSWQEVGGLGEWTCGYCQQRSADPLSPGQGETLADCRQCGRTNRIVL